MRVRTIEITNFKGFQHETVRFNGKLTVVIGNNTAGKTTLLKALQVGLGAYLQSLSQLPNIPKFRRNFARTEQYLAFDPDTRDYLANQAPPRITIEADFPKTELREEGGFSVVPVPIRWFREFRSNHTTHSLACAGELMSQVQQMEHQRYEEKQPTIFPLVLSFGTKHTNEWQVRGAQRVKEREPREERAYKYALLDNVDYEEANEWLRRYDKNVRDKREFEGTREAFMEALETAIPALSEIDYDGGEIEALVSVAGRTPERHHFSYMSDGLQSMITIVSEIAHRCIELNGHLGTEAVKKTPGVVLIDEIDLYLHPHWPQHVLHDLTQAFPEIQFIVTTHSPFIVQSLPQDQLISFDPDVNVGGEPFRESIEDIAADRMGMEQNLRSRRFNKMVSTPCEHG